MPTTPTTSSLKLIAIGNSRGVRLPQILLRRYGMADQVTIEQLPEGLLLRGTATPKLSLKQTFAEMAREQAAAKEDWSDLDSTAADGLDRVKW